MSIVNKEKIEHYLDLLEKWGKIYNLTSIVDREEMYIKHILDSLSIKSFVDDSKTLNVLDVGTGAGLPGIPLAIELPGINFHLVDCRAKKTNFLKIVVAALELKNVFVYHSRVEDLKLNMTPQIIVSRAFSSIELFGKLCKNLADDKTEFLAMKGKLENAEVEKMYKGFVLKDIKHLNVDRVEGERTLVRFNKEEVNSGKDSSIC